MSDAITTRMKDRYENRTRYYLPRRTYTIIRVDGRAFHTHLRKAERPFDINVMALMDRVGIALCEEAQGCSFGYTQSDECSLLLTDFERPETEAWFDGNLQKICSISASIASTAFNRGFDDHEWNFGRNAVFDCRVFVIPDPVEVENYFIGRQRDAERNSILMLAQHYYSPKQMHGKDCGELQDMIHAKGDNWNNYADRAKRGGIILRFPLKLDSAIRHEWRAEASPMFTKERKKLEALVPRQWATAPPPDIA
jgi:tRNA(His) 5'-end guanylyltransferase